MMALMCNSVTVLTSKNRNNLVCVCVCVESDRGND